MKKVVMFVYGNIVTDARVLRAARALSGGGYAVTVISIFKAKRYESEFFRSVQLHPPKFIRSSFAQYILTMHAAYKVVKKEKPDIFYAHDYYSAVLVKKLISRKFCNKIVYDAHELIVPEGKKISARMRFFYRNERKIVNRVDLLVCANEDRAKIMADHYNLSERPLVVRNISHLNTEPSEESEKILEKLQPFFDIPKKAIVYAGVVNLGRHVEELVAAAQNHSDKVKILIVGGGNALNRIKEMTAGSSLVVEFTGPVPYSCMGQILCRCDVGYIYYPNNTLNNRFCASNKIYEYASVNLPVIANDNSTIKKDLAKYKIGVSSRDIEEALVELMKDIDLYKANCELFCRDNSWENEKEVLVSAVDVLFR